MGVRIFAIGASLTILAAMTVALGIYFGAIPVPMALLGMSGRTTRPEFSARYYPPETVAYAWVTLAPRGRQMRYMRETWDRLNEYPGFVSAVDEWKSGFTAETGASFDLDLASWTGPTMSAGLLDIDADTGRPTGAAVIGVRDEDAAAGFLGMWIRHVSAGDGAEYETGTYRETQTWISGNGDRAYALTGNWLVYATDESTLHAIVDRIDGSGEGSLARMNWFETARDALPDHRFASAYLDYERGAGMLAAWGNAIGPITPQLLGSATGQKETTEWIAGAATWVDRGLVTEWVTPSARAGALDVADLGEPAALLPEDTLGFVAASFDPNVDHWRTALATRQLADALPEHDPSQGIGGILLAGVGAELGPDSSLADVLDQGLDLAHQITGIDLETAFFRHLAGTATLAVRDFDITAVREDPAGHPVDAVAMLSYKEDSRDELSETMNRVAELARNQAGIAAEATDVGAKGTATVFDLEPLGMLTGGGIGYRPGYVLHNRYLTMGTTEQSLATVVGLQNGQGESLSADGEYRRAMQYLPTARKTVAYVDARRIVRQLDAEDLGLEEEEYEALRDATGAVAMALDNDGNYRRTVAVVTLFPE